MSGMPGTALPSVLIVENDSGDVFIVEDKKSKSQVEKILKTEPKSRKSVKKLKVKLVSREPSPETVIENIKVEDDYEDYEIIEEEYLDEYREESLPVSFIDTNGPEYTAETFIVTFDVSADEVRESIPSEVPDAILDHQYVLPLPSDRNDEYSDEEDAEMTADDEKVDVKEKNQPKPLKHKFRQLTGKTACKYCDTIFRSKDSLKMHVCKYLQCDPKNFICRICGKELSRKTFSNHLHETLDCQYCGKSFVNPRNMKSHIRKLHRGEKFIPPKSPPMELFEPGPDETKEPVLDETTGLMVNQLKPPRKKYPRKTGRFECDLCGRIFTTVRSLKVHMDLHTNSHRYVCTICGEKYTTHTGISKHACLNKRRRRPEVDFRIYDVRHCKYCGASFSCLEDNKAHSCEYQNADDPKLFRCRFCLMEMSKNSYNKHMSKHLTPDQEATCGYCHKKLSDESALAIHITTHTGDRPFKCIYENCGQSFINRQLLVRHTRFHGAEIPMYTCAICDKSVASKYHLKTHMKVHSDKYECQLCREQFETRDQLRDHYTMLHEPFPCPHCDKTFTLPRYLKMHEKLHMPTGVKPFKCELCSSNKAFTKIALLLNHVLKSHNEQFEDFKNDHPELFK